jgi:hypothetical protein
VTAPVLADLAEQVQALRKPMSTVWATAYNEAVRDVLALLRGDDASHTTRSQ